MKFALFGLGNPGSQYFETRHNVGHWFLDSLTDVGEAKYKIDNLFETSSFSLESVSITLIKSLRYMNLNGIGLANLLRKHSFSEANFMLVQDEVNLPLGTAKLSHGKSAGGHNGVSSVLDQLGYSPLRLRIGVSNENKSQYKLSEFVLSKFSQAEKKVLDDLFPKLLHSIRLLICHGFAIACNYTNRNPIPSPTI